MKIGIMGGTFNPVHNGHLFIAEEVRLKYGLDEILFIPVGKPPHKVDNEILNSVHRYEILKLAIRGNDKFSVSDIEIKREGYTYTIETLRKLASLNAELYYIVGADTILTLEKWKKFDEVAKICSFIGISRPGVSESKLESVKLKLIEKFDVKLDLCYIDGVNISSTDIRNRIKSGQNIKYLLPDAVAEYIYANQLYR